VKERKKESTISSMLRVREAVDERENERKSESE
jgi:hypothetical protein